MKRNDEPGNGNGRRVNIQAWMIALAFAVPMVTALLMTLVPALRPEGGTRNYGTLIDPPALVEQARWELSDGDLWLRGRWTLLQVSTGPCVDDCRDNLDKASRMHQALGRHHHRLQHVLLMPGAKADRSLLQRWPELRLMGGIPAASLARDLPMIEAQSVGLLLVDPWGYAMMRYPVDYDPSAALKDLQRLMRYAKEEAERRALEDARAQAAEG